MKKICVFCGSSNGKTGQYLDLGKRVGALMSQRTWGLVYGGGKVGVMGAVANSVLENGCEVIGVIPKSLVSKEVAHFEVTKLHVVEDMHERKRMMYDFSDLFLVLPGGMGTLDEMFEILTWAQLGLHNKPIYLLNEFGFYDSLIDFLKTSAEQGFIREEHLRLFQVINKAEDLLSIKI
jgi:uncharacterized protein (TIGR00730 family)